ncbi:hypothetical protein BJ322DRAFT_1099038 [Thelephora terrestris]|uniref:Uncharacterized protein n=1 Tax=Thelephora terrestris TaxID=56493 RepID=A0A9P6L9I4_9AGAM|nr:hypothetical protein BJ322DRAFT_1099038 [Thelephora terrestris]
MALNAWKSTPERAAIRLVRSILGDSPSPLTTKQIYEEAVRRETGREYPEPPTVIASTQKPQKSIRKRGVVLKPPPTPPHPDNAIRSVRYLKAVVLPHMSDKIQEIEKFHTTKSLSDEEKQHRLATMSKSARKAKASLLPTITDVWLWRMTARPPPPLEPKKKKPVFGVEVGVGEDWLHLNKRRQRAREGKVVRDVTWLRELTKMRREREGLDKAAGKETIA